MRRHQHTFTFATFTNLLARSTPHEAKLHLLRNVELFHARPDMLTRAVAAVPWDTALALLDCSFYVVKDIEPKTYQLALRKMSVALRERQQQQQQQHQVSTAVSSQWRQAIRVLSRLVAAEGDQTPPSAFVDAAQCLAPERQWEAALQLVARPADSRGVASRALMLSVAESCATSAAWLLGLRAFSLGLPPEWLTAPSAPSEDGDSGAALSASDSEQQQQQIESGVTAEETAHAATVAARLLSAAPWRVGLALLLQEPSPRLMLMSARQQERALAARGRILFPWQAAEAVLTNESATQLLLERWITNPGSGAPVWAVKKIAANSCLGPALLPALPSLLQSSVNQSDVTDSTAGAVVEASSAATAAMSSPAAMRLALSLALRARDANTAAALLAGGGGASQARNPFPVTRTLGPSRCSAAIVLLAASRQHRAMAAGAAERCIAEGAVPLAPEAIRAAVASVYHQHDVQPYAAAGWRRAMRLVSRGSGSASTTPRAVAGESVLPPSQPLLDAKSLTQLIHLCVFGDAATEALRLVGWAKQRQNLRLRDEGVLTALLFCAEHGRWQEAVALFEHTFPGALSPSSSSSSSPDAGDASQSAKALLPIVQHMLREASREC